MKIKGKSTEPVEVDMTPMIDMVFQLIAFFMVVSNFEQTQADERVKLPKDALAKPPEVKRENELVVNLGYFRDSQGNKLDPPIPYVFYIGEKILVQEFGKNLKQEARLMSDAKTKPSDITVVIRADSEVPTGLVQELIKLSQEAGFEKFALKATQKIDQ